MDPKAKVELMVAVNMIGAGNCTPIISNQLMMDLYCGTNANQIASDWANSEFVNYPVKEERYDLARIAQYVSIRNSPATAKLLYQNFLKLTYLDLESKFGKHSYLDLEEIKKKLDSLTFTELVADELHHASFGPTPKCPSQLDRHASDLALWGDTPVDPKPDVTAPLSSDPAPCREATEVTDHIVDTVYQQNTLDVLAAFPVKVYVTTSPHLFLERALHRAGKTEYSCQAYDRTYFSSIPKDYRAKPGFQPTENTPLVYHLFGIDKSHASLVLSEDDHLEFLTAISKDFSVKTITPNAVQNAITQNYLLLLGYDVDSWELRAVLKGLVGQIKKRPPQPGVAIQIDPQLTGERIKKPDEYREYLVGTFSNVSLNVFWDTPRKFIDRLWRELNRGQL